MAHTRAQSAVQKARVSSASTVHERTTLKDHESTGHRSAKRTRIDSLDDEPQSNQKRPGKSCQYSLIQQSHNTLLDSPHSRGQIDPIQFWATKGEWPRGYFRSKTDYFLARKKFFIVNTLEALKLGYLHDAE
ncbi:hypothetical protein E4U55_003477 [Claviceps digitariae]|nr:hypothetical protein E4U55_003477 [Claviceps digitariae]